MILKKRKSLKGKGYAIFEDATLPNHQLLYRLHNHQGISQQWMTKGKIWALTKRNVRFHIDIMEDINKKIEEADANQEEQEQEIRMAQE